LIKVRILIALLCYLVACAAMATNLFNAPHVDEVAHLPSGVSHWKFARFEMYRVNPPLVRLLASPPAVSGEQYDWRLFTNAVGQRPEFAIGRAQLSADGLALAERYVLPRILASSFLLITLLCLSLMAPESLGIRFPIYACLFLTFCPNFLAHAATIGPDVGAVAMGLVTSVACWRYLHKPAAGSAAVAGGALGLALLTKLTWLTGLLTFPATVLIGWVAFRGKIANRRPAKRVGDLCVFWSLALFTLNAGYLFDGTLVPLGEYEFCSETFGGEGSNIARHGNRFREGWLAAIPVPFPRDYVLGIDFLRYEVESKRWSFLMGQWRFGGWYHYYLMAVLLKTPVATLVAACLGFAALLLALRRRTVSIEVATMMLFLAIPSMACFASVSLSRGFNHHHRYILMIYPLLFALAAFLVSPAARDACGFRGADARVRGFAAALPTVLLILTAVSSLRVYPHFTSYFNVASGGPERGWHLLGFSNVDWGQDLTRVADWIEDHPDRRPIAFELDYSGVNGEMFGLPRREPPALPKTAAIEEVRRSVEQTEWWIISVKRLYDLPGEDGLQYLQKLEPVDRIAYAYHVYRIDPF
jgi:hypothetical protein